MDSMMPDFPSRADLLQAAIVKRADRQAKLLELQVEMLRVARDTLRISAAIDAISPVWWLWLNCLGKAARVFTGFAYITRNSWSRARRVVAKAEYLDKGENPRFVVTSLTPDKWPNQDLYEKFYCARGEMENRIKEQMCLFADRLSTDEMKDNQLRLYFSALAYSLIEALRRIGLKGTEWAQAQVDTIRLKLFKIGAIVRISVRRILLQLSSTYPWKDTFAQAFHALRC